MRKVLRVPHPSPLLARVGLFIFGAKAPRKSCGCPCAPRVPSVGSRGDLHSSRKSATTMLSSPDSSPKGDTAFSPTRKRWVRTQKGLFNPLQRVTLQREGAARARFLSMTPITSSRTHHHRISASNALFSPDRCPHRESFVQLFDNHKMYGSMLRAPQSLRIATD